MSELPSRNLPILRINREVFPIPYKIDGEKNHGLTPDNPFEPRSGQNYNAMVYEIVRLLPEAMGHPIYFGDPASQDSHTQAALMMFHYDTQGNVVMQPVAGTKMNAQSFMFQQAKDALIAVENGWQPQLEKPQPIRRETIFPEPPYGGDGSSPESPLITRSGMYSTTMITEVLRRLNQMKKSGNPTPALYYGYGPDFNGTAGTTLVFRLHVDGQVTFEPASGSKTTAKYLMEETQHAMEQLGLQK